MKKEVTENIEQKTLSKPKKSSYSKKKKRKKEYFKWNCLCSIYF